MLDRSEMVGPLAAVMALLALVAVPGGSPTRTPAIPDAVLELASPGVPVSWPVDGRSAMVTPSEAFEGGDGIWCRTYRLLRPGLPTAAVEGTACRSPDGEWRPQALTDAQTAAVLPPD